VRNSWIRRTAIALGLFCSAALGLTAFAKAPGAGFSDATTLAADIAFLQKGLAKDPQKREIPTLKAAALLVALNAQNGKRDQSGIRDGALAVAEAISKKDYAKAKTLVAALADAKPTDKKAVGLVEVSKIGLEEVMSCFRKGTVGGLNLEADVKAYGKAVGDVKAAGVAGGRIALIADYTLMLPPENTTGDKKAQWDKWSKEMGKLGSDVTTEVGKGDKADKALLMKTFKALEVNCNACHTVFRQ